MDVVKQWTLNICLTLIGAVILSLVSPRGSMGRFYKTVLSLFIIAGFLLPITGGDDPAVREKITTTVASLFGIPTNRISVSKLKGE